jgi:DNA-binding PadR family transcriptional regulator
MEPSQTAYVILGMLSIHPHQSGYHIRKTIECTVNYFWSESYGQIYPTLKRLAAEGLIVARPSTSAGARRSREYSLTAAGQARLQEWLALPYRGHPPRDEFLLKLFFGGEVPPGVSIGHLRDFQEKNRRLLATLLELETLAQEHNSQNPQFPFWMLTLSYGLAQIRSALEWSESALAMLSAQSDRPLS